MIETSVAQTIQDRQIAAYIQGCDERTIELRGYGLTEDELLEVETEARELYA